MSYLASRVKKYITTNTYVKKGSEDSVIFYLTGVHMVSGKP
jgi:hypothetical protein